MTSIDETNTPAEAAPRAREEANRRPYAPPRLERLGEWSALTLQQSVPIFP